MAGQLTQNLVAIAPGRFGSPQAYGYAGNGAFFRAGALYIICSNPAFGQNSWANAGVSGDPPPVLAQARALKSIDDGLTWAEVDIDNGPAVSILKTANSGTFRGLTSPMAACYQDADTLLVAYWVWDYVDNSPPELRFSTFDMSTDSWGAETTGGPVATTVEDQPQLNMAVAFRSGDGALIVLYDGYERIAGTNYARMFYVDYNAGWGPAQPLDAAQTGSTDDYRMSGAVAGDGGRTHLFYVTVIAGVVSLLQNTLDNTDTLIGPVTITALVDTGSGHVPPFGAPWSAPGARSAAGVTTIFVAYVKDDTVELNYQAALSDDSPTFAEVTIGGTNCAQAGISNCGPLDDSRGLAAATQENINNPAVSGSQDGVTWEAFTPLSVPADPAFGDIGQYLGLGIEQGGGGLFTAGVVVNSFYFPPE